MVFNCTWTGEHPFEGKYDPTDLLHLPKVGLIVFFRHDGEVGLNKRYKASIYSSEGSEKPIVEGLWIDEFTLNTGIVKFDVLGDVLTISRSG